MARKTRLMREVEERYQRQLEYLVPEKVNDLGLSATASELGVSKATSGVLDPKARYQCAAGGLGARRDPRGQARQLMYCV